MDIVVLAGGLSTEREVSLVTGSMVSRALRGKGHRVIMLDVFFGYGEEESDITDIFSRSEEGDADIASIRPEVPDAAEVRAMRKGRTGCFFGPNVLQICRAADLVFLALHGENGENGKVQATFDLLGIRYTGSGSLSSALAMDKGISKKLFKAAGIPTPPGISMEKSEDKSLAQAGISLPCVVKPCSGGSSIGVFVARTEDEFDAALQAAFCYEDAVVIETYIEGREFSVGVVEGLPLPVIEIAPAEGFYDYRNKYKAGSAVETCPADIRPDVEKKMREAAVKVCEALGINTYCRMDFLVNAQEEIFCLEANTLPGMTPTSLLPQEAAAIGIDFPDLCEKLIEVSLKKYE